MMEKCLRMDARPALPFFSRVYFSGIESFSVL